MKQQMRVGMLASLMIVPAVAVSANENIELPNDVTPIEVSEQSASAAVVVASFNPNDARLNELHKLNESTVYADIDDYYEMLDNLQLDVSVSQDLAIHNILTAKLDYIDVLNHLKKDAQKLNSDIGLLKTTNPNTIAATVKYANDYATLVNEFRAARDELDAVVDDNAATVGTVITNAISHLAIYTSTLENYILTLIPNYTILQTFEAAIVEPQKFIESTATNPVEITIGDKLVNIDFEKFAATTALNTPAEHDNFREQAAAITLYMATKLTNDGKKIVESHKLADGRTVSDVLKEATIDIASADKVEELIAAIETTEFKSESTFLSRVKAIETAYNKLSPRGKSLARSFDAKVTIDNTSGKNAGYLAAKEVIEQITALKPAATEDYREALKAANTAFENVYADYQQFILNKPKLDGYNEAVTQAKLFEVKVEALNDTTTTTTASQISDTRDAYDELTSAERKVVLKETYEQLQEWEKTAKDSIKVNAAIEKIKIENSKTFATNTEKAKKQYDDLGSELSKGLADKAPRLQLLNPLAILTGEYYALKVNNTPEYRTTVRAIHAGLDGKKSTLTADPAIPTYATRTDDEAALSKLYDSLLPVIAPLLQNIEKAELVEAKIDEAYKASGAPQLTKILEARADYNDLDATQKKIVNNLKTLTDLEKIMQQPSKVAKQIIEVIPTASNFESKAKSAITAYDKLTTAQKAFIEDDLKRQIADFKSFLEFSAQMKTLKITSPSYRSDVEEAKAKVTTLKSSFTSSKLAELIEALKKQETTLAQSDEGILRSDEVVALIENLPTKSGEAFIKSIEQIELAYGKLSANDKKLVTNYKQFQTLKKDATTAIKVVNLINNSYILNNDVTNSGYEKAMKAAITAYDKLSSAQRMHVYNYDSRIKPNLKIYDLVVLLNKMKPTNKTFWEEVRSARLQYDNLTAREKTTAAPLLPKIVEAEQAVTDIQNVMNLIDLAVPGSENYVENLKAARAAYDRLATLNSAYQKLVQNYKQLQEREKSMSPVTSSIYEIKELEILLTRPFNDAEQFVKKYQAAVKAYERIPFESRQLVTNRDVLLNVIYPVASTMEAIANIKENSSSFGADVAKAREMYSALSTNDKKLVTNYNKLAGFEVVVSVGSKVDELIRAIPTFTGQSYMQAIKEARAAYDQLSSSEKRAVALYKQLQSYEKAVKTVMTAIDLIDALQFSSNLVSAYDKATKALDKLTAEQRLMVSNIHKLTSVTPAIEVYKMIENLKVNSESYAGSVQAAYAAYNRLTNAEKQYVTNFAQLQEAKNNIDNLSVVIAKIAEIIPGSRNYATQVQEALALYNALPTSMKKLVTNYIVLKDSKSELDAVERVRSLIAEIDTESTTFVQKIIAARTAYDNLTANQRRLVSNYFMLEEYERELGTMF